MKEFTREFETKRRWRLWNGPSLVQTSQLEMCYWDDERILPINFSQNTMVLRS